MKAPERGFVSTRPAENWQEALATGNGKIGALVMSNPTNETIIFSHERLFMPWDRIMPLVDLSNHIDEIRRLIEAGHYHDAGVLAQKLSRNHGYDVESVQDRMRWPDPFVPAFDLLVNMPGGDEVANYARSLDWETGVATVEYEEGGRTYTRKIFVSRPDNIAVLSIRGESGTKIDCELSLATRATETDNAPLLTEGIRADAVEVDGDWISYRAEFTRSFHGSIQGYEGLAHIITDGSTESSGENTVRVTGAEEVVVQVWLGVLYSSYESAIAAQKLRLTDLGSDFPSLLDCHKKVHGEIFSRMRLDLGGSEEDRTLSSEELGTRTDLGNLNRALLEKQFDACRYGVLSSTGDWPPALQGVWTGTWNPRWKGDYTIDGNIQSAIASMLVGNMPECMKAYIDYTMSFLSHYRENARQIYGYRGILMPSRTSSHGYLNHFSYDFMWMYWISSAAWAAHYFYEYYLFTGDRHILEDRIVPFMKEVALFYEDFLYEGSDGEIVVNPSYSPECTPANSDSQVCINATMDIGFAKELLTNLVHACEQLGIEESGVDRWKRILKRLPAYLINDDGAVKEWVTDKLHEDYAHRHASHLCFLVDNLPDDVSADPRLREGFRVAVEKKMEKRRALRDRVGVMAFGIIQLGQAATSLGDTGLAYETVDKIANKFWRFTNMTPTHDPDGVFNMDAAGGLPAVIIKMLVMSKIGEITLLPCLPREWPTGSIEGVLCRGQIEVRQLTWDSNTVSVSLVSQIPQNICIQVPLGFTNAAITEGASNLISSSEENTQCAVALIPGEVTSICFYR